jgi:hypothetical protein
MTKQPGAKASVRGMRAVTAAVCIASMLMPVVARAQTEHGIAVRESSRREVLPGTPDGKVRARVSLRDVRALAATLDRDRGDWPALRAPAAFQAGQTRRQRSVGRKVLGGAIGAVGGFFAGGYLGAAIDGDCGGCDDPGFKGALIGAPIGAVVGGILGATFF